MNKFLLLALTFLIAVMPIGATAAVFVTMPFGGRILSTQICVCQASLMITVENLTTKTPTNILYTPFVSRINLNYMPTIGNQVVGTYFPAPTPCTTGLWCTPMGAAVGTVTGGFMPDGTPFSGIGTSLTP